MELKKLSNGTVAVNVKWNGYDYNDKYFEIYRNTEGSGYTSMGLDYTNVDEVHVLNIYPYNDGTGFMSDDYSQSYKTTDYEDITFVSTYDGKTYTLPKSASLKMWMEQAVDGAPKGYGKGIIHVTPVKIEDFVEDPDKWLDPDVYDVVALGTWDANANNNKYFTSNGEKGIYALNKLNDWVASGKGYIDGHDVNLNYDWIPIENINCYSSNENKASKLMFYDFEGTEYSYSKGTVIIDKDYIYSKGYEDMWGIASSHDVKYNDTGLRDLIDIKYAETGSYLTDSELMEIDSKIRDKYNELKANGELWDYYERGCKDSNDIRWGDLLTNMKIRIREEGLLTQYPWRLGDENDTFICYPSHCSLSYKTDDPDVHVWMEYADYKSSNRNVYVITRKNVAKFQTGHSLCYATSAEKKLYANTIFYINQLSFNRADNVDKEATDKARPDMPTVSGLYTDTATFSATDNGTHYSYYVESYDKNDVNKKNVLARSSVKEITVTTGVEKYRYLYSNESTYYPTASNGGIEISSPTVSVNRNYDYINVATIDGAGNESARSAWYKIPKPITVNHYVQNVNGTATSHNTGNYTLKETETKWGFYGNTINIPTKTYENFNSPTAQSVTIESGKSGYTVNYYYSRNISYLHYKNGQTNSTSTLSDTEMTYGRDVTFRTIGTIKGREYELKFNSNAEHANDVAKNSGKATTSEASTKSEVTTTSSKTGNLSFKNWKMLNEGDIQYHIGDTYNGGRTVTAPNFTLVDEGDVYTEAQWNNTTLSSFDTVSLPGYQFQGWYDKAKMTEGTKTTSITVTPGTTKYSNTLYAHWKPNTYTITFNGNGNWNTNSSWSSNETYKGQYTQTLTFDSKEKLTSCQFTRNITDTNALGWCSEALERGYELVGWDKVKTRSDGSAEFKNLEEAIFNLTETNGGNVNYYAIWKKDLTLTFDYGGGLNNGTSGSSKKTYTLYNNKYKYNFDISDMYGTYDSNGMNNQFTKIDTATGKVYRFLGWSRTAGATTPDSDLDVFNSSHKTKLTLHDNDTLYAVWEEALVANVSLNRSIGDLTFTNSSGSSTGVKPRSTANNIVASTNDSYTNPLTGAQVIGAQSVSNVGQLTNNTYVEAIIKPGEQGQYSISTLNTNVKVGVAFDSRITDIYTHNGLWTDSLNPSGTGEELNGSTQKHSLDRAFNQLNTLEMRKFYLPQYLGTNQSYKTSNPSQGATGTNLYYMKIKLSKPSYYYQSKYGKDEEINVTGVIYTLTNPSPTTAELNNPETILDDLRTRLTVRIR